MGGRHALRHADNDTPLQFSLICMLHSHHRIESVYQTHMLPKAQLDLYALTVVNGQSVLHENERK